jgi:hypothetical protein
VASSTIQPVTDETTESARNYEVEKLFYDDAENIEAVNINYACTPLGGVPDWNSQRVTLFLPLVEPRQRRKTLKLPARILDSNSGQLVDRYLLHYYFEIFADGDTHYSSLYTEEVVTGASAPQAPCDAAPILVKEPVSEVHDQPASAESEPTPYTRPPPPPASKKKRTGSKAKEGKR